MNNRVIGVKKSQFSGQQSIPGGSYFDFVFNGQNYRIKDTDFFAALGVTGTIVQDGDPLGIPVLDVQGSVNAIRNLVAGLGVSLTILGDNSIKISFTALDAPPILTTGTRAELIAALGLNGLGFVDDSANLANLRPNVGGLSGIIGIVSGVVTLGDRGGFYRFDTEALAATDVLDTITDSGAQDGDIIVCRQASSARDITFSDSTGNLFLNGDFTPGTANGLLLLFRSGPNWFELSRSPN